MENVFLAVLNMSLTASYIIPFVVLARLLLKKVPKIYSYSLWSVVLFRLLCPFSLESALSLLPEEADIQHFGTRSTLIAQNPEISTGIPTIDQSINPDFNEILPTAPPPETGNSVNPLQIWTFVAQMLWGFGIVLMLLVASVSLLRLKKKLRVSKEVEKGVFFADDIRSPFVFGVISPKIYLPSTINEEEIPLILAHERFHLKRFDHVTRLLSFIALTLHWFNPLVWISYYLSEKDMETSCDEGVLREKSLGERGDYATALLKFTDRRSSLTPLAFSENDTKGRVKNIMKMKKTKLWVSGLACVLVVGLVVGFSTNSSKNLSEELQTYVVGDLELRYYGTLTPLLEATYPPDYYDASILEGTLAFLHAVLPEYFLAFDDPDFEWNGDLLSVSTLEEVKSHVEMVYKMADFQASSSHLAGNEYLLTVDVLPVYAFTGLTEETLNSIKTDENFVGNVDLMVQAVLSHLDSPQKAKVREEYIIQYTYDEEDGFVPNMDEVFALYERIVVFRYGSSPFEQTKENSHEIEANPIHYSRGNDETEVKPSEKPFSLTDFEDIILGKTTQDEVEAQFGQPDSMGSGAHFYAYYEVEGETVFIDFGSKLNENQQYLVEGIRVTKNGQLPLQGEEEDTIINVVSDLSASVQNSLAYLFTETQEFSLPTRGEVVILESLWDYCNYSEQTLNRLGEQLSADDFYVLNTSQFDDTYYSVVMMLSEGPSLSLVQHSNPTQFPIEIYAMHTGEFAMSSGVWANVSQQGGDTFVWLSKRDIRHCTETDTLISNDIQVVKFRFLDGTSALESVSQSGAYIFKYAKEISSCEFLNGENILVFEQDFRDN
ncbi:MAG: M56 family metallopeptidase [Eubacteriales bacterium]